MPNFVKNKIIVGKSDFGKKLFEKYTILNKDNLYEFDFNKVIKMPDSLNVEFSTKSNASLALYLTYINPYIKYFGNLEDKIDYELYQNIINKLNDKTLLINNFMLKDYEIDDVINKFSKSSSKEELLNLGKIQIDNIINYNALNWYDWNIKNWGCKWNSSNFNISEDYKTITYETPWNPAKEVIIEISRQNPEMKFGFLYSDENIGANVGYMLLKNGVIDYAGTFADYSCDAYRLAFDLWGCEDDYIYSESKKTYVEKDIN